MKRRNADIGKMRRPMKRNKIAEGLYGSTLLYLKFLIIWALVILADFILEFRFEFLWPFYLLLRSVYDSFKYQGLAFSVFFVCVALTSDMLCFFFIPVHWLFFAASTYVWVQYVWHTDKGICAPTIVLWMLFVYLEAAVRLRDIKHMPGHLDLCRPFAAHCIGYPVVTLGFGFKSYIGYRMRQRKQRDVAKENEFYLQLMQQALPVDTTLTSTITTTTTTTNNVMQVQQQDITTTTATINTQTNARHKQHLNGHIPNGVANGVHKSHRKSMEKSKDIEHNNEHKQKTVSLVDDATATSLSTTPSSTTTTTASAAGGGGGGGTVSDHHNHQQQHPEKQFNNNNLNNNYNSNSTSSNTSNNSKRKEKKEQDNKEREAAEYLQRLEQDAKRLRIDLQNSRSSEQELRLQVATLTTSEKVSRGDLLSMQRELEDVQNKLQCCNSAKAQDRQTINNLERRMADERRVRATIEAQLTQERKTRKQEEVRAAQVAAAQTIRVECTDVCRQRRRDLETEIANLRSTQSWHDDKIQLLERDNSTLAKQLRDTEILLTTLNTMQEKNQHLENSLSAETRIKLDLFSALGEAKRQLEIKESCLRAQEKEIDELKSKIAQVLAVMPNDSFGGPPTPSSAMSRVRLTTATVDNSSPGSTLDPNATAYTPKGSLVASTEA